MSQPSKIIAMSAAIVLATAAPAVAQSGNTGDTVDVTTDDSVDVTTNDLSDVDVEPRENEDRDFPWGLLGLLGLAGLLGRTRRDDVQVNRPTDTNNNRL